MPQHINFTRNIMFSDAVGNIIQFDESSDFFQKWNQYTLTIDSDNGPLIIKWSNLQALAANWFMQTGAWIGQPVMQNFFEFFPMWCKWTWWNFSERGIYNLPNNPQIIDIGAGNSIIDLLLSQYIPDSKFLLIDRNKFITAHDSPKYPTSDNPCWQHSWSVVEDAITSSNIDKSRFKFLDTDDEWNVEADLITSHAAWCMHFPIDYYWDRMLKSLKIGGRLVLDINIGWEQEYLEKISDALNCRHTILTSFPARPVKNAHLPTNQLNRDQINVAGYRCSWTRYK